MDARVSALAKVNVDGTGAPGAALSLLLGNKAAPLRWITEYRFC